MLKIIIFFATSIVLILAPTVIICIIIKVIKPKWGGDPLFFYHITVKLGLDYYFYNNFSHKVIVTIISNSFFFHIDHFVHIHKKFSLFFEIIYLLDYSYKYISDKIWNIIIYIYKISVYIHHKVTVSKYIHIFKALAWVFALILYVAIFIITSSGTVNIDKIDNIYRYLYIVLTEIYDYLLYIVLLGTLVFSKLLVFLFNGIEFPLDINIYDVNTNNTLQSSNNSQYNNQLATRGSRPNSSQSNNPSVGRGSGSNSPQSNSQLIRIGSRSNSPQSNSQLSGRGSGSNSPQSNSRLVGRGSISNTQDVLRLTRGNSSQDNIERVVRRSRSLNTNNQSGISNDRSRSPIDRVPNYRSRSPINQSIVSNNPQESSNEVSISSSTQTTVNSSELTNTQSSILRSCVVWQQRITNMMLLKGYVLTGHEFNRGGILIMLRDLLSHVDHGEILVLPDLSNINMNGKEIVHEFINEMLMRNLSNQINLPINNRGMPLNPDYFSFEHPDLEEGLANVDPLWMYTDGDDLLLGFTPNYWVLTINSPEFNHLNAWQQTYKLLAQPIIYLVEFYENNFYGNLSFETEEEEFYFHKNNIKNMESKLSLVRFYLYLYPSVDRKSALVSELVREIDQLKEWYEDAFSDMINSDT